MILGPLRRIALDYHRTAITEPRAERMTAALARHVGRVDSLLDVGCGDGVIARAVGDAVGAKRVAGVDVVRRATTVIDVDLYDGTHLPFEDASFDAVTIVDVVHHCQDPLAVMREVVRVARRVVVVKDHFSFGPLTHKILYLMDRAGNERDAIECPSHYLEPRQWVDLFATAGAKLDALEWPMTVHSLPWRLVAWSELQFVAKLSPARVAPRVSAT